ncbi:MAG: hypothetical protein EOO50_12195 [Flavobacterium sp.]|uniref:hypothetical protein n=1 Tax=Flavobacterium sp. TaxID=239 RepID=UPI00122112BC|nr:hypothetical protein [Flavobacterium sp.]RZJ65874.1 MAG: hypothetical protein EOO50_12195 [Flavobacterium sp.]
MKYFLTFLIATFAGYESIAQQDLNIEYKLRGHVYAASSVKDTTALGGFGGSDNFPKPTLQKFSDNGFFLKIDTTQTVSLSKKFNGYKLYIVNASDKIVELEASDSRLPAVAQVFLNNKWQDIEYLPSSWCGNSYHKVFIEPNQYWEFEVPKFSGKLQTKLRYKLEISEGKFIYSNEIKASVNKKQLTAKEGHEPQGLMDPYND